MPKQTDAELLAEHNRKVVAATTYDGFGVNTTIHMPCGFCAAPDWLVTKVIDVEENMKREHVCKSCGRGIVAAFLVVDEGGKAFELMQTCGDDPPAWMPPPRRRVS